MRSVGISPSLVLRGFDFSALINLLIFEVDILQRRRLYVILRLLTFQHVLGFPLPFQPTLLVLALGPGVRLLLSLNENEILWEALEGTFSA